MPLSQVSRIPAPDGIPIAATPLKQGISPEHLMRVIADRRGNRRFSLRMAIKCRQIEPPFTRNRVIAGESLNISSKGLLFTTTEAFQPGQIVEASIDWPVRLENRVRLALVVEGSIVRRADDYAAMRIDKYEFRTRGAPAE